MQNTNWIVPNSESVLEMSNIFNEDFQDFIKAFNPGKKNIRYAKRSVRYRTSGRNVIDPLAVSSVLLFALSPLSFYHLCNLR